MVPCCRCETVGADTLNDLLSAVVRAPNQSVRPRRSVQLPSTTS
jgi:hypothetical protein